MGQDKDYTNKLNEANKRRLEEMNEIFNESKPSNDAEFIKRMQDNIKYVENLEKVEIPNNDKPKVIPQGRDYVSEFLKCEKDVINSQATRISRDGFNDMLQWQPTDEELNEFNQLKEQISDLEESKKKSLFGKSKYNKQIEDLYAKQMEANRINEKKHIRAYEEACKKRDALISELENNASYADMSKINAILEKSYNQCVDKAVETKEWIDANSNEDMKTLTNKYVNNSIKQKWENGAESDINKKVGEYYKLKSRIDELSSIKDRIAEKIFAMENKAQSGKSINKTERIVKQVIPELSEARAMDAEKEFLENPEKAKNAQTVTQDPEEYFKSL